MSKVILGVDPGGVNAACSWVDLDKKVLQVEKLPTMAKTTGKGNIIEINAFAGMVGRLKPDVCYFEQNNSRPGQAVSAVSSFWLGTGMLLGVLASFQVPVIQVTPGKWKKKLGLVKKEKDYARTVVLSLYPNLAEQFKFKKDVDKADALLIALYGVSCEE